MPKHSILPLVLIALIFTHFTTHADNSIFKPPQGVSIHKLDNGINVILIENPALPMIGINTVVKVGSAYETFASSGMSHMLEHLLFNGSSQWTQKQMYDMTAKIGGYNNANTAEYYTNYMMVTPTDNIEKGMRIQAGMLFDSTIPVEKFEKEKAIVLEEIAKSLANSRTKTARGVREKLFAGHAISLPTLGTYETIKNMDRDDVVKFYKNNYVPNNMEISVIGDFKTAEMLKLLKDIYGVAKPGNVVRPNLKQWATGFNKPIKSTKVNHKKIEYLFHQDKDNIIQSFYALDDYSDDFYALLIDAMELKQEKLEDKLKQKYPEQIKSIKFTVHNYPVAKYLQADVVINNDENISAISKSFDAMLNSMEIELSADFIHSKAIKAKSTFLKQIEKPHMFGIYNADMIAKNGLGSIIKAFSGHGIIEAGKQLQNFKLGKRTLQLIQYPKSLTKDNETKSVSVKLFDNIDIRNNAVIIAKQNSMSELLAIHYMFKYKENFESSYGKDFAKMWHDIFGQRMKSPEVQKKIAKFGLSFKVNDLTFLPMDDIYLSPTFGYIRVEGLATDIEAVISFLNNAMLDFKPSKEEFEKELKKAARSMHKPKNKAKESFKNLYDEMLFMPNTIPEPLVQENFAKFLAFGQNYFTPNNLIVSVVSKQNPESIYSYFENFTSLDKPQYTSLANQKTYKLVDSPQSVEKVVGGEQSYTFYGFIKPIVTEDKAALTVLSLMLKDDISFNLREKQGLAYRVSVAIDVKKDQALFYIKVPTLPKNVDKLVEQFPELISPKFSKTITQDNLDKTVNKYLGRMMFRRLSSINQAYYLAHSYYYYGDITTDGNSLEALKQVSLGELKKVAKKYLDNKNPIQIIVK